MARLLTPLRVACSVIAPGLAPRGDGRVLGEGFENGHLDPRMAADLCRGREESFRNFKRARTVAPPAVNPPRVTTWAEVLSLCEEVDARVTRLTASLKLACLEHPRAPPASHRPPNAGPAIF